jgi:4-amino-4-deoxy-L-arabinose transferase-like glycosyltransferase
MTLEALFRRWSQGWRGPALAGLIAFLAGLPGLFAIPPLDRDESRFAQATAQMLETDDFVVIRFQDAPRFKKPVGIHWMQAASVAVFSRPEAREIWAYRLPSLIGAMMAAAACAWGARAFFGGRVSVAAGAMLGASLLLSTEAFIAKTDAMLCGTTTLAMAGLARLYAGRDSEGPRRGRWPFWIGLSLAALVKGPVGPMVVFLALGALALWDRRARWIKDIGWGWGLILFAAICGPWAGAVTTATDGAFWTSALIGDLAPKLAGGQETHGAPPGYHLLLTPLLFFPATLLLPAAAVTAWTRRSEPGVRFAICWLVPAWIVFELAPTKLVHYPLPLYGALAWLAAASLQRPLGAPARWVGIGLSVLAGAALAGAVFYLCSIYGDPSDLTAAALAGGLLAAAGFTGAYLMARDAPRTALAAALAIGVGGHAALAALFVPRLEPLWLSRRVESAMEKARLLPRQGVETAPVAVAGYAEPSLVFALGTPTELGGPVEAAQALEDGRPAVVEAHEADAFRKAIDALHVRPRLVAQIKGLNYSNGDPQILSVYRAEEPAP